MRTRIDHIGTRMRCFLLAGGAILVASPAFAGQSTNTNLSINTNVPVTCVLTAQQVLQFSTAIIQTTGQTYDADGIMRINCTNGAVFGVTVPQGPNDSSTQRRMTDGAGHYMLYNLYASTTDRSVGSPLYTTTPATTGQLGDGGDHDYGFYGRIPIQPTPPVGNFTDQLTVTVSY